MFVLTAGGTGSAKVFDLAMQAVLAQVALDPGAVPEHRGVAADEIDVMGLLMLQLGGFHFDSASVTGKSGHNRLNFFF